jgi:sugar phosphate isomerase/epimerase
MFRMIASVAVMTAFVFAGFVAPASAADSGMYVSMRDAYLGPEIFPTIAEGLKQLAIDSVELTLTRDFTVAALDSDDRVELKTDEDAKAYRRKADELGVKVCGLLTACDFSAGNMADNSAWIGRSIELANLLGAPAVRIDSAMKKEKELPFETRVNLFVEGLKGALDKTASSKVTLGIENHGFQGNNLAFLLNVFMLVGNERLGSTMDSGNFYWRGYPLGEVYGILRVLSPHAKHTHMKNIKYPEDQREVTREAGWKYSEYACPLDEGDIDMAKVVGMLAAAGYRGDVCIEDESVGNLKTKEEKAAVCKRNVDHLKKAIAGVK